MTLKLLCRMRSTSGLSKAVVLFNWIAFEIPFVLFLTC